MPETTRLGDRLIVEYVVIPCRTCGGTYRWRGATYDFYHECSRPVPAQTYVYGHDK